MNTDAGPESRCAAPGLSCSTSDIRAGFAIHRYLSPHGTFDPWLGVGVGLDIARFSATGVTSVSVTDWGIEFLNLELGGDWNITREFAIGPFVSFSLDKYESISTSFGEGGAVAETAFHEWLLLGVRAVYDAASM